MLFITNRVFNEGPTPLTQNGTFQIPRSLTFALQNNQAEQSVYFCQRRRENDYREIGNRAFFTAIKESPVEQILIYIHGFSNFPESAIFRKTAELQRLFNQKSPNAVLVIPIIWPCGNNVGLVRDYFDDQKSADASDIAFMRLLEKFLEWRQQNSTLQNPCLKWINVLAHSMGNRVLRGALSRAAGYYQVGGIPQIFRNVFMAAADVMNEALEPGQEGHHIPDAARNVVVYYAADDLALRASKVANVGNMIASRRLGHTGPERMAVVPRNVYAIDCDDFNNRYDSPTGHGYFGADPSGAPGLLFDHMWECIRTGRVPMNPANARTTILNSRFWL
ncbi:alpha/beta hydrolase [Trichothermofontia sp.]